MEYQKIPKYLKNSQQNDSESVTNENDKTPKEKYISAEERQKIIYNIEINIII